MRERYNLERTSKCQAFLLMTDCDVDHFGPDTQDLSTSLSLYWPKRSNTSSIQHDCLVIMASA
ncbi:hypothetical protein Plhal304r1_c035g0109301 [Plasmopara halstedii]